MARKTPRKTKLSPAIEHAIASRAMQERIVTDHDLAKLGANMRKVGWDNAAAIGRLAQRVEALELENRKLRASSETKGYDPVAARVEVLEKATGGIWQLGQRGNGEVIAIRNMTDRHLVNALRICRESAGRKHLIPLLEAEQFRRANAGPPIAVEAKGTQKTEMATRSFLEGRMDAIASAGLATERRVAELERKVLDLEVSPGAFPQVGELKKEVTSLRSAALGFQKLRDEVEGMKETMHELEDFRQLWREKKVEPPAVGLALAQVKWIQKKVHEACTGTAVLDEVRAGLRDLEKLLTP
jgi:hypothetical protein